MIQRMVRTLFPATLLCAVMATGCQQGGDGPQARAAELAQASGIKITIQGAELGPEQVHELTKSIEGKASDVGAAMVRLKKDKDDPNAPASVEIELWGSGLPASAGIADQLKADFPALASAQISVSDLEPGSGPQPIAVEADEDASPEEAKQQIIEQLEAEGVDGQIDVNVEDVEGGRRIEVKVKKEEVAE